MDMTGDGAVVDPLQWRFDRRGGAGVWSGDDPLGAFQIVERHNAVVAHSRQQAAEIERLTRERDEKDRQIKDVSDDRDQKAHLWRTSADRVMILLDEIERLEKLLGKPPLCNSCGVNRADLPSKLCPGCQAYREHTGAI